MRSALVLAVLAAMALTAGCGGGGGGGSAGDATPPTVSSVNWSNPGSPGGGQVTIQAWVQDAGGVGRVEAVVTASGGAQTVVPMSLGGNSLYAGTYAAPGNPGTTAMAYSFVVRATDAAGNTAASGPYQFEVPAADVPPPPPAF